MNVATNYQYAGPSFSKSAPLYFTTDNFATQYATLANPFPAGLAPPQGRTYGKLANWGFDNGSDLDTGVARNAEIYQWNLGLQHLSRAKSWSRRTTRQPRHPSALGRRIGFHAGAEFPALQHSQRAGGGTESYP